MVPPFANQSSKSFNVFCFLKGRCSDPLMHKAFEFNMANNMRREIEAERKQDNKAKE